ncbi:MAG: hypothetical protein US49_C0001G0002 [candidate division TM6 bacterium GW2011_GWF2_37_49]|nr:MAG: hypothetical protein US49_C0001G0002 [candidate division TM6 bacterium GW2011_GWF2_37_49]
MKKFVLIALTFFCIVSMQLFSENANHLYESCIKLSADFELNLQKNKTADCVTCFFASYVNLHKQLIDAQKSDPISISTIPHYALCNDATLEKYQNIVNRFLGTNSVDLESYFIYMRLYEYYSTCDTYTDEYGCAKTNPFSGIPYRFING